MNKLFFAAALCAGFVSSGTAFAEWQNGGTFSTTMMQDGDVMMKLKLPPAEFAAISKAMKTNNSCVMNPISAGESDTITLVCGAYAYRGQFTSKP